MFWILGLGVPNYSCAGPEGYAALRTQPLTQFWWSDNKNRISDYGVAKSRPIERPFGFEEKLLEGVAEFIQYTAHSIGAGGDKTFYEATMEFKTKDDAHVVQNQVVVTTWKDGEIVFERYYHGNA